VKCVNFWRREQQIENRLNIDHSSPEINSQDQILMFDTGVHTNAMSSTISELELNMYTQ
jgi:hypothetical protein